MKGELDPYTNSFRLFGRNQFTQTAPVCLKLNSLSGYCQVSSIACYGDVICRIFVGIPKETLKRSCIREP